MNEVLIVLSPRNIKECIRAIEALEIDKLWLHNMTELRIEERWEEAIERIAHYDRAYMVSDDAVPHQSALDAVRSLLDAGHPVATGYCNLAAEDMRVNLSKAPLGEHPTEGSYDLMHLGEVQCYPEEVVPTYFSGFCLTGMALDLWKEHAYHPTPAGWGADFKLCQSLAKAEIPIVAHRSAFVWHVKEKWSRLDQEPRKRLLIGLLPEKIELTG